MPQASNNNATRSLVEIMILTSEKILEIHQLIIRNLVEQMEFFARAPSITWWTRSMHNKISSAKRQSLCISWLIAIPFWMATRDPLFKLQN